MAQINFRVNDDVKAEAEKALKAMGLNMTTAINMFLVKVAREKRIPFEVNVDPFYSEENKAELERRLASIENGTSDLKEHDLIRNGAE